MTNEITYRAEIGINGDPIVVAECGDAAAVYDVQTASYSFDGDDDQCPIEADGCWPTPPEDVIEKARVLAV